MTDGGERVLNLFTAGMQVSSAAVEGGITEAQGNQTSCLMRPMS